VVNPVSVLLLSLGCAVPIATKTIAALGRLAIGVLVFEYLRAFVICALSPTVRAFYRGNHLIADGCRKKSPMCGLVTADYYGWQGTTLQPYDKRV
jgi:hypothetical protein